MTDFIFLGSKITAGGDCSHEIKRRLLLGRKAMTNLDSILKSRDITWMTKVHLVKALVFPVVMYGSKSWTIKKAECRRTDAFELCWRKLLRVPWTARKSNQSILKKISPEYSLEGLMLKLKLQYFGHLMRRTNSLEKPNELVDAGKDWRQEEKRVTEDDMVGWHHCLNGHEFEQPPWDGDGQGSLACWSPWGCKESDMSEWLNWTEHPLRRPRLAPHKDSGCSYLGGCAGHMVLSGAHVNVCPCLWHRDFWAGEVVGADDDKIHASLTLCILYSVSHYSVSSISISFCRRETWGPERWNDLYQITSSASGKTEV